LFGVKRYGRLVLGTRRLVGVVKRSVAEGVTARSRIHEGVVRPKEVRRDLFARKIRETWLGTAIDLLVVTTAAVTVVCFILRLLMRMLHADFMGCVFGNPAFAPMQSGEFSFQTLKKKIPRSNSYLLHRKNNKAPG
jgi:hypothetical protein